MGNRGLYNRKVSVQAVTNTQDEAGGNVVTYVQYASVMMSRREVSGSEGMEQLRDTNTTRTVFKTSGYLRQLSYSDKLVCEGVTYDIVIIKEYQDRSGQEITCISKY